MCQIICHRYRQCYDHERVLTLCPKQQKRCLHQYHSQLAQQQKMHSRSSKPRSRSLWNCFSSYAVSSEPLPRPLLRPTTTFSYASPHPPRAATEYCCDASSIRQETIIHPNGCANCTATRRTTAVQVGRSTDNASQAIEMSRLTSVPPRRGLHHESRRLPIQSAPRTDKALPSVPPPPQPACVRQGADLSPTLVGQLFAHTPAHEFYDMYPQEVAYSERARRVPRAQPQTRYAHQQVRQTEQTHQQPRPHANQSVRRRPLPLESQALPPTNRPLVPKPLMTPSRARQMAARDHPAFTPSPLSSTGSTWSRRPVSPTSPNPGASKGRRYVSSAPQASWV